MVKNLLLLIHRYINYTDNKPKHCSSKSDAVSLKVAGIQDLPPIIWTATGEGSETKLICKGVTNTLYPTIGFDGDDLLKISAEYASLLIYILYRVKSEGDKIRRHFAKST